MKHMVMGFLIEKYPNFYFMPSLTYDQIFLEYSVKEKKMSCAYWVEEQGYTAIPLILCEKDEATHWIVEKQDGTRKGIFDEETKESCEELGYKVTPVKTLKGRLICQSINLQKS